MAKAYRRAAARLARRKLHFVQSKSGDTRMPGSLNSHKCASTGTGRRSRAQVKAASRAATSR